MKNFKVVLIGILCLFLLIVLAVFTKDKKSQNVNMQISENNESIARHVVLEKYVSNSLNMEFLPQGMVVWEDSEAISASGTQKSLFTVSKGMQLMYPQDITYYSGGG